MVELQKYEAASDMRSEFRLLSVVLTSVGVFAVTAPNVQLRADGTLRPRLQIMNCSEQSIDVLWLKSDTKRVSNGDSR